MESLLLDNIDQPSDLKNLDKEQVNKLCAEIRQFLLRNISRTGGHLASNLGAVELTVALHRVMTTPMDKIVFDVGASVLYAQTAHRPTQRLCKTAPAGWHFRFSEPERERARCLYCGAWQHSAFAVHRHGLGQEDPA